MVFWTLRTTTECSTLERRGADVREQGPRLGTPATTYVAGAPHSWTDASFQVSVADCPSHVSLCCSGHSLSQLNGDRARTRRCWASTLKEGAGGEQEGEAGHFQETGTSSPPVKQAAAIDRHCPSPYPLLSVGSKPTSLYTSINVLLKGCLSTNKNYKHNFKK